MKESQILILSIFCVVYKAKKLVNVIWIIQKKWKFLLVKLKFILKWLRYKHIKLKKREYKSLLFFFCYSYATPIYKYTYIQIYICENSYFEFNLILVKYFREYNFYTWEGN